jgi:FixJ family two-component response regulator
MSGYQDYGSRDADLEPGSSFVQKPFSRDNLLDVIAQALKKASVEEEQVVSTVQAMVTVPMKVRRRSSRRSRRPMAV